MRSRSTSPVLPAALASLLAGACNELPKRLVTGQPLAPSQRLTSAPRPGVPSVVYASPSGTGDDGREIVVVFSEPMAPTENALRLSPSAEGATRWAGEHTLVFVPRAPLPVGRYEASVVGVRGKNGQTLETPHGWSFAITAPASATVARGRARAPGAPLLISYATLEGAAGKGFSRENGAKVYFNAPVDLADLERKAKVQRQDGRAVDVQARSEGGGYYHGYVLRPKEALQRGPDVAVTLKIEKGLLAADQRPAMEREWTRVFATMPALRVHSIGCPGGAGSPMRLHFNAPIDAAAVLEALEVTPSVKLRALGDGARRSVLELAGAFRAGTEYRVRVPATLATADNAPLGRDKLKRCTAPAPQPRLQFAVEGSLLEQAAPKPIPVWAELVDAVVVRLRPVPEARIAEASGRRANLADLPVAHEARLSTKTTDRAQVMVDPSPALKDGRGLVLVEIEGADANGNLYSQTRRRLLLNATDLGLTTKQAPSGVLVWTTRLSDGSPVEGARVVVRDGKGKELGAATTGEDGVAEIAAKLGRYEGYFVAAQKDGDVAWHRTDENQWMFMPSSFDVPEWGGDDEWAPGEAPVTRGLVFSERGIYRPGDLVRLKGIVRRETSALETVAGAPAWVAIKNEQGEEVLTRDLRLSEFGTFNVDVPLSEGASLGTYKAIVTAGASPSWRKPLEATFRVEEYRAPDFEVKVEGERADLFPGEPLRATVRGRYLFGARMQGAPVAWRVTRAKSSFTPPKHPGFVFRPDVDPWASPQVEPSARQVVADEGVLDEQGERVVELARPEADRVYVIEGTVTGLDRTQISARRRVVTHPAAHYLGVQAEWTFMELTETFRGDLVVVAPDGSRQAGVPIEATIYQGDWESVRHLHAGGTASTTTKAAPKKVGGCALTSAALPVRCAFKAKAGGQYVLWAKAKDSSGHVSQTGLSFYVMGPTTTSWAASDDVKMTLQTDRHEYKVGDTARILVQNPFPEAEALVTIERERVLRRFRQKLVGPAPAVRIPITEDLLPNVFVSVVAVRGRVPGPFQPTGDDPRRPLMRVGHAMLRVSPESRRVSVDVLPERTEYRPRDEVSVRLRTLGPDGQPIASELTVWAVDEGVLSLVAYETPDPVKAFAGLRGLGIMTSDTRYRALRRRAFEEKGRDAGGGGGGTQLRKKLSAVAFFDPSVRTDARGEATVRFSLPDNLTTFRVMAVAVTREQRFGKGDARIVSTKRLLLQASLPRLLRAGDRVEAGVVAHNRTAEAGEVRVSVAATGLAVEGPTERVVRIPAGRGEEIRFTMRADAPGTATLRFAASLGRERDGLEVTRRVLLPTTNETLAFSGEAKEAVRHVVGPVEGARSDVGGLELVLSGSRLAGLAPSLAYLMEYPYGCAEQTTSGLLPLIALRDLAEATGEALGRNVKDMIDAGLRRLSTFQRQNGGFSMWPDAAEVSGWASGYVMFALAEAKRRGLAVEEKVLKAGAGYLRGLLAAPRDGKAHALRLKANALYALAALGAAEAGQAAALFEDRQKLDVDGRALLARALVWMKDRGRATTVVTELLGELGADRQLGRRGDDDWRYFASPTRSKALVLEALAAFEPSHPLIGELAGDLLAARHGGRWRTTQEAAYSLFALSAVERAEAETAARKVVVWVNGAPRMKALFGPGEKPLRTLKVPMGELRGQAELVLVPSGGPIRYSARLVYAPTAPRTTPTEDGLSIHRTYERVRVPEAGAACFATQTVDTVSAGDLVRVTLHLVVPKVLRHVVVDDPLPAGLEAVNVTLATEATTAGGENGADALFTHRELRDDRVVLYAPELRAGLYRRTYLARATTPGRYAAPSPRAEGMYAPERQASAPASIFTVVPPRGGVASK